MTVGWTMRLMVYRVSMLVFGAHNKDSSDKLHWDNISAVIQHKLIEIRQLIKFELERKAYSSSKLRIQILKGKGLIVMGDCTYLSHNVWQEILVLIHSLFSHFLYSLWAISSYLVRYMSFGGLQNEFVSQSIQYIFQFGKTQLN